MSAPSEPGESPLELLKGIQQGTIDTQSLSAETRRVCVEHLLAEAYGASEIAEILKVSTRTIQRDQKQIQEQNALQRDPKLVDQFVGKTFLLMTHSMGRLHRLARNKANSASSRIEAEMGAWRIHMDTVRLLQRLGFLPEAAREIRAELTHHMEIVESTESLRAQLETLQQELAEGEHPEALAAMKEVENLIARADASKVLEGTMSLLPQVPQEEDHGT